MWIRSRPQGSTAHEVRISVANQGVKGSPVDGATQAQELRCNIVAGNAPAPGLSEL